MAIRLSLLRYAYNTLLLCLFSALFLTSHNLAYGQSTSVKSDDISSGELMLNQANGSRQPARLKSTQIDANINGLIARVIVKQEFVNNSSNWAEGEYLFPLPTDSAADYMAMIIGERKIIGKIHEKQQAKKIYEQAKREGKKASIVEQHRPNLFRNKVANIAPGETISVELHYVETLKYDQGTFSLRVPTTITPRYIPGQALSHLQNNVANVVDTAPSTASPMDLPISTTSGWASPTDQVPDAHSITPPMTTSDKASRLQLTATINPGLALSTVKSVYHTAQVSENNHIYSLQLDSNAALNKDVLIEWTPDTGTAPAAALFHQRLLDANGLDKNYMLLMLLPPQQLQDADALSKETIFVIDTSGSMAGNSITQAQQALLKGLSQLKPQDRFNIIEFDSQSRALWPEAKFASNGNIDQAGRFVNSLVADGGTEMMGALKLAFMGDAPAGYVRQVIFITDGSVGNEENLFNFIENKHGNSRIFTVGIGSAPNSFFMQRAAEAGKGSFTFIGATEDIQQRMADLFFKLENPVLANIEIDFGQNNSSIEFFPNTVPDLYMGEPLVLAISTNGSFPDAVEIHGERNQSPFFQSLSLQNAKQARDIDKVWARKKIQFLSEAMRRSSTDEKSDLKTTITQLALDHQLLSKFTSFVAVEEKISRPQSELIANRKIPNAMPEGNTMLSNPKSAVAFTQTALGLNQLWLLGSVALAGFLFLFIVTNRFRLVRHHD